MNLKQNLNIKRLIFILLFLFIKSVGYSIDPDKVPPLIPYWAFGHWIWEDERNTSEAVKELTQAYFDHQIPVDALIIDSPWMVQYNDFIWDCNRYPQAQQMIDDLQSKGIKVLTFYTGCLNSSAYNGSKEKCEGYDFAVNNNFCVNQNKESKWFKGPGVHVDMTKDEAKNWWHSRVDVLHKMKLNGAKIDFGFAWFGDSVQTSIGLIPQRDFAYHYYADAFDYNLSQNPEFVAMTYAWSGLGLMGFPSKSHVNWVGDFKGDWQGIKDQLKNIYLSANYGFSGIACEIGGYWKIPSTKEQFIRYTQLSSFCPVMINGGALGAFNHHLPWKHDLETVGLYRKYVALHKELSPYLFSTAVDAHLNNSTIIKNADIENECHLLGNDLFVKVISDSISHCKITFPNHGNWIDLWDDDQMYAGGANIEKIYSLDQYPVFIKSGAIIPLAGKSDWMDIKSKTQSDKTTFLIYPNGRSSLVFHQPKGNGIEYQDVAVSVDEENGIINFNSERKLDVVFLVKQHTKPRKVKGADAYTYNEENKMLKIEKSGTNFQLKIQ